jgi:hypothetical protein
MQQAWLYLVDVDHRKEQNDDAYRKTLIQSALNCNQLYNLITSADQPEVLVRILNEIHKSITSAVLDKHTRKYILLDLLQPDVTRTLQYTNVINDCCVAYITNQLICAELALIIDDTQSKKLQILLDNVSHGIRQFESNGYNIAHVKLVYKITATVFNNMQVLDKYVASIQPINNSIGHGYQLNKNYHMSANNNHDCMVVKYAVNTKLKQLQSSMYYTQPHDTQQDVIDELCTNITNEIISDIIGAIYKLASCYNAIRITDINSATSANDQVIRNICANASRGNPTFVIVNQLGLNYITSLPTFASNDILQLHNVGISNVGILTLPVSNSVINVLLSNVAEFANNTDSIVLYGYRGLPDLDSGLVYHPYILCMFGGVYLDDVTFKPMLPTITRSATSIDSTSNPIDNNLLESSKQCFGIIVGPSIP